MARSRIPRCVEGRFWVRWGQGVGVQAAAVAVGVSQGTAETWVRQRGGVKPEPFSSGRDMTLEDRIAIQAGIVAGHSDGRIARTIGRHRSTVGRELKRNVRRCDVGPANRRRGYNALMAQNRADDERLRPKPRKLDENAVLHDYVQLKFDCKWSPEQIAHRLRKVHGKDPEMTISHEAIYQALYVNSAGGLQRELKATLRTGRKVRRPRRTEERRGRRADMTSIVDRPQEALGRAVPGHWEGDLVRHEALFNRAEVEDLRRCAVAAA